MSGPVDEEQADGESVNGERADEERRRTGKLEAQIGRPNWRTKLEAPVERQIRQRLRRMRHLMLAG